MLGIGKAVGFDQTTPNEYLVRKEHFLMRRQEDGSGREN